MEVTFSTFGKYLVQNYATHARINAVILVWWKSECKLHNMYHSLSHRFSFFLSFLSGQNLFLRWTGLGPSTKGRGESKWVMLHISDFVSAIHRTEYEFHIFFHRVWATFLGYGAIFKYCYPVMPLQNKLTFLPPPHWFSSGARSSLAVGCTVLTLFWMEAAWMKHC